MVQERMVQGWQVWKCFNCCIDVCAIDLNNSVALVNMDMEVFYLVLHPHHVSSFFVILFGRCFMHNILNKMTNR